MRSTFLDTADLIVELVRHPAVGAAWDKPSALPKWTVGGLAGHLARQVLHVPRVLDAPPGVPITALEHYARVGWIDTGIDSPTNARIRADADADAAGGIADLLDKLSATIGELGTILPATPGDQAVRLPWAEWSLTLDDFLLTRLLEIVIHTDDLAVSAGIPTPTLPRDSVDPVLKLLLELSVRRHGPTAVLRGLSRAERAPNISAF